MRKLILYIAASLDGYIAGPDDDLGFLKAVEKPGEDYGYSDFENSCDTVIMGRKTFDWVLNKIGVLPHPSKKTYVITRTKRHTMGNTEFYTGDPVELVKRLKEEPGKNIYCDGGATLVNLFLDNDLIDELIISVIPVLLGRGLWLFEGNRPTAPLILTRCNAYETGLVQLHYRCSGNPEKIS